MFLGNLNIFVACLVVAGMTVAGPVALVISMVLTAALGSRGAEAYVYALSYLLIAAFLAVTWWRVGLSPSPRKPGRERRFRIGHGVLAFTNAMAAGAIAAPLVLASTTGNPDLAMLAWFALPVYALAFLAWPAGLFMVWSSRA